MQNLTASFFFFFFFPDLLSWPVDWLKVEPGNPILSKSGRTLNAQFANYQGPNYQEPTRIFFNPARTSSISFPLPVISTSRSRDPFPRLRYQGLSIPHQYSLMIVYTPLYPKKPWEVATKYNQRTGYPVIVHYIYIRQTQSNNQTHWVTRRRS